MFYPRSIYSFGGYIMGIEKLKPFINGKFVERSSGTYMDIYDPSTGEVIAQTPCCTNVSKL
jgi:hypothetical protein